ncbi:hypothetical protein EI94DRAFT_868681 [Lactarius quietus]|nr:hypothetical protein EI94DRAFT_868681 [Lactarius quietus]
MGDLDRYIHLEEIFVDFIQRPPTSVLELVFKDDAGVKQISNKFNQGDLIHWSLNTHARTHTSATLTIQQSLSNISVAVLSVEFEPNEFRDYSFVELEDSNHCVAVNIVCGRSNWQMSLVF